MATTAVRSHGNVAVVDLDVTHFANVKLLLKDLPGADAFALIASIAFAWLYPSDDPIRKIDHYLPKATLAMIRLHMTEQFGRYAGVLPLVFKLGLDDSEGFQQVDVVGKELRDVPVMRFRTTNEGLTRLIANLSYHGLVHVSFKEDEIVLNPQAIG